MIRLAVLVRLVAVSLAVALPIHRATAQAKDAPAVQGASIRVDANGLVIEKGAVDADELVTAVAGFLGRNIAWPQPEHGKGRIEPFVLQRPIALDAPGSEEVLSQLLWARGWVLVPVHADKGLWQVLLEREHRRDITGGALLRTTAEIQRQPGLRVYVRTVVELRHRDATVVAALLQRLFGGAFQFVVVADRETAQLTLAGFQDDLAQALRLLRSIDRPTVAPPETPARGSEPAGAAAASESPDEKPASGTPPSGRGGAAAPDR